MLPPLATVEQLEGRIRLTLSSEELAHAEAVLQDASSIVRHVADESFVDAAGALTAVPDIVVSITLQAAARKWNNPDDAGMVTLGSTMWQAVAGTIPGVFLTPNEESAIRKAVGKAASGVFTLRFTRPGLADAADNTVFVPVSYGGDPMPWQTVDDGLIP